MHALEFPFFQRALIAGLLASVACGVIGAYVVAKRIASISGGLAHSAFGGVGLAYLLQFDPMVGAVTFGLASGVGIGVAYRHFRHALDTLIAMAWSVGMALGIVFIALTPGYAPDLMSFLFGSILFVPVRFLWFAAALDAVILVAVFIWHPRFQAVCFDEEFAEVVGVRVGPYFLGLLALTSLAVVVLIRSVGVILVIALLTIPASIARQWSDRLPPMMLLGTLVGAVCTTSGLFLSYWLAASLDINVPTGPLIILIAVVAYGASVALRAMVRQQRNTRNVPEPEAGREMGR